MNIFKKSFSFREKVEQRFLSAFKSELNDFLAILCKKKKSQATILVISLATVVLSLGLLTYLDAHHIKIIKWLETCLLLLFSFGILNSLWLLKEVSEKNSEISCIKDLNTETSFLTILEDYTLTDEIKEVFEQHKELTKEELNELVLMKLNNEQLSYLKSLILDDKKISVNNIYELEHLSIEKQNEIKDKNEQTIKNFVITQGLEDNKEFIEKILNINQAKEKELKKLL